MPRYLSTKHFYSDAALAKMLETERPVALGQIVGHVNDVQERKMVGKDGEPMFDANGKERTSLICYGTFEGVNYETGEVKESAAIYLPPYYAKEIQSAFNSQKNGQILFGVEISIEASGRAIPYQYELRNITGIARSAPLEALKRAMGKAGVLRLPLDKEPEVTPESVAAVASDEAVDDGADVSEPGDAPPAAAKGKRRAA
jgi:hypothetical protein